jgi:hypothetical protein
MVLAVLKHNPRGLTVTGVSKAMGMNRNSVAKYLEMLLIAGRADMKTFCASKVYCVSQRLPKAAMLSMTSDYVVAPTTNLASCSPTTCSWSWSAASAALCVPATALKSKELFLACCAGVRAKFNKPRGLIYDWDITQECIE